MKKIYLSIIAGAFVMTANAQLSLTQAFNEPVISDVQAVRNYDSVGVIPKNTGADQMWDFSAVTSNTVMETTSFTSTTSAGPNAGIYTGATLADFDGGSFHTYYKSTTNQLENLGFEDANIILNFTNTAITSVWPITFGSNFSDVAAGTCTAIVLANATGTVNGLYNVTGTGTGTLMLPGGAVFNNVLQTVSTPSLNIFCPSTMIGPFTLNSVGRVYDYYVSSQKFPILSVVYEKVTGNFPSTKGIIQINSSVVTGINDANFDASFSIFPNPAKNNFNIKLNNATNDKCSVAIVNSIGQTTKTIDLGNDTNILTTISISDLNSGVYMVKTTLGDKVSVRKLIVN
ncbi:MAG: T9SS type A sorting domain-containing protein [Bacteroidota bacterium]